MAGAAIDLLDSPTIIGHNISYNRWYNRSINNLSNAGINTGILGIHQAGFPHALKWSENMARQDGTRMVYGPPTSPYGLGYSYLKSPSIGLSGNVARPVVDDDLIIIPMNYSSLTFSGIKSTDGGATWTPINLAVNAYAHPFTCGISVNGRIMIFNESGQGIYTLSTDGGATWSEEEFITGNLDSVYCATMIGDRIVVGTASGDCSFMYSDDDGVTWTSVTESVTYNEGADWNAICSDDNETLMAVNAWSGAHDTCCAFSVDSGETWTAVEVPGTVDPWGWRCAYFMGRFWFFGYIMAPSKVGKVVTTTDAGMTWKMEDFSSLPAPSGQDPYASAYYVSDVVVDKDYMYVLANYSMGSANDEIWCVLVTQDGVRWNVHSLPYSDTFSHSTLALTRRRLMVLTDYLEDEGEGGNVAIVAEKSVKDAEAPNSKITVGTVAPPSPKLNDIWIDTTTGTVVKSWSGTAWV